jgi:hypothetical protein
MAINDHVLHGPAVLRGRQYRLGCFDHLCDLRDLWTVLHEAGLVLVGAGDCFPAPADVPAELVETAAVRRAEIDMDSGLERSLDAWGVEHM